VILLINEQRGGRLGEQRALEGHAHTVAAREDVDAIVGSVDVSGRLHGGSS